MAEQTRAGGVRVPVADAPEPPHPRGDRGAHLAALELGCPVAGLEHRREVTEERRRVGAVDGPVVEGQREHPDRVDGDRLAAVRRR